jgi:hypothetical protein
MSKYTDLCQIYRDSRNEYFQFEKGSLDFAEKLVANLIAYLSIPEKQVRFFPTIGEANPTLIYSARKAMRMGPDTYWYLGIGIELQCNDCPDTPDQPVLINLALRKDGDLYLVKMSENDQGQQIKEDLSNAGDFYDFLFNSVKDLLQARINRYINTSPVDFKIGFQSNGE